MNEPITYVGIDAHKRELHVAMLVGEASTPVTWTARNEPRAIDRLRRKQVIAPALVPRKPGDRIKTDRRDARKLAELHRAGLLTEVCPPTPAKEAVARSVSGAG